MSKHWIPDKECTRRLNQILIGIAYSDVFFSIEDGGFTYGVKANVFANGFVFDEIFHPTTLDEVYIDTISKYEPYTDSTLEVPNIAFPIERYKYKLIPFEIGVTVTRDYVEYMGMDKVLDRLAKEIEHCIYSGKHQIIEKVENAN